MKYPEFAKFSGDENVRSLIALAVEAARQTCFQYRAEHFTAAVNNFEVAKMMDILWKYTNA
jgi:hypothetical protein